MVSKVKGNNIHTHYAAHSRNQNTIYLSNQNEDIHTECLNGNYSNINENNINSFDRRGCTPLYYAAYSGNLNTIIYLINHGADIELTGHNECTPLMAACESNSYECVKCLIDKGANVNKKEHDGVSVLHFAVRAGNLDIVKLLVESGADIHAVYFNTSVLQEAKNYNRNDIIGYLQSLKKQPTLEEYATAYNRLREMFGLKQLKYEQ